jgi:hypothetical protein
LFDVSACAVVAVTSALGGCDGGCDEEEQLAMRLAPTKSPHAHRNPPMLLLVIEIPRFILPLAA